MRGNGIPETPAVLDTTVLSNFAYIDRVDLLAALAGICTVPVVRQELQAGMDTHPYLQPACNALDDAIPVVPIPEVVANREAIVTTHLDPGEAPRR